MLGAGAGTCTLHLPKHESEFTLSRRRIILLDGEGRPIGKYEKLFDNWKNLLTEEYCREHESLAERLFYDAVTRYNVGLVKRLLELFSLEYLNAATLSLTYRTNFLPEAHMSQYKGMTAIEAIFHECDRYYNPVEMIRLLMLNGADVKPLKILLNDYLSSERSRLKMRDITWIKILLQFTKFAGLAFSDDGNDEEHNPLFDDTDDTEYDALTVMLLKHMWEILGSVYATGSSSRYAYQKERDIDSILASCRGSKDDIERAVKDFSDVNASTWLGYTPLMYASVFNTAGAVRYLIDNGASASARSMNNQTALTLYVMTNYGRKDPEIVGVIARNGADVNAVYDDGSTPLMLAAEHCGKGEIIAGLVDAGADVSAITEG